MFATHPPPAAIDFHLNTSTTTSPLHYQDYNANAYAPSRPSPLAMSQFSFATPQHHHQHQYNQCPASSQPSTSTTPPNRTNYAQRYATTIANPLSSVISPNTPITTTNNYSNATRATRTSGGTSPTARAHRRTLFLNRIKQDRDAGRFEARGEQLVLMEDAAEEKRRRESMGRRAERIMKGFGIGEGEDENEMKIDGDATAQLDEFLSQEQAMESAEMALFETMEHERRQEDDDQQHMSPSPGSYSDDEYDDIFMDLADPIQDQEMDMS